MAIVAAVSLLALSACETAVATFDGTDQRPKRTAVLTPDGTDRYVIDGSGGTAHVAAPASNTSGNLRIVFWPTGAPAVVDALTCATWSEQQGVRVQQGAALRLQLAADGRLRGVIVTKNILWGASWNLDVHTFDSARAQPLVEVGSVSMASAVGSGSAMHPLPWHLCARTSGATLEMQMWTGSGPEPAWSDAAHTRQITLPAGWTYAGTAGWYVGHLLAGDDATFTDLRTWREVVQGG